jgi:hypothetical protein
MARKVNSAWYDVVYASSNGSFVRLAASYFALGLTKGCIDLILTRGQLQGNWNPGLKLTVWKSRHIAPSSLGFHWSMMSLLLGCFPSGRLHSIVACPTQSTAREKYANASSWALPTKMGTKF